MSERFKELFFTSVISLFILLAFVALICVLVTYEIAQMILVAFMLFVVAWGLLLLFWEVAVFIYDWIIEKGVSK